MHKFRLKVNDKVKILSGSDKEKLGTITAILKKKNFLIVSDVNLKFKHEKPSNQENSGKIRSFEAPIHYSNVMLCDSDSIASRFQMSFSDGKKVRISKKTKQQI